MLSREEQESLREKLLAANPTELKVKIEHEADITGRAALAAARRPRTSFGHTGPSRGAPLQSVRNDCSPSWRK